MLKSSASNKMSVIRLLGLIMISATLVSFLAPVKSSSDVERLGLKGKVKNLIVTKYKAVMQGEQIVKDTVMIHRSMKFNREGYETESKYYQYDTLLYSREYILGTDGIPLRMKQYNKNGRLHLVIDFKYDSTGRKTEAHYRYLDQSQYFAENKYSELLEEVFDMRLFTTVKYTYNFDGLLTDEEFYYDDGQLMFKNLYRYDYKENLSELVHFNALEHTSWYKKFQYDRNGLLTESNLFVSNRIAVESTYTYTFDEQGNWTTQTEVRKVHRNILTENIDEGPFVTERTIVYYR